MREQDNTNVAQQVGRRAEVVDIQTLRDRRYAELMATARTLMIECRDEDALAACQEALRLVPGSEDALVLASTLCAVRGSTREALCFAMEMVETDPTEADGYYEVAMALLDMGHPEQALAWLEMGECHMGARRDDILDFFSAAQAEALALLCRYEEAEAALETARNDRNDELGLIEDAEKRLIWLRRRKDC